MGKAITDVWLDGTLDQIATGVRYVICAGEPLTYAAITAQALAETTLSAGDFTKANGDVSGRKVTVAQKTDVAISATGDADHVVVADATANWYVTTCTLQPLTSGGTVTGPAWDIEIADPT